MQRVMTIIGIVSRFVSHKEYLIEICFDDIINLGYKMAIIGSGEKIYEDFFRDVLQVSLIRLALQ